jgi:M6 family metalloprotease-like protein
VGSGWVRFNSDIDVAWVLTNSSFDDILSDEDYRFYTEYMGNYVILTGKYNADINELLEHPDMSGVECRLKSYIVNNLGGTVFVNGGSEYILRSPDIETMENITEEREKIYTDAKNVLERNRFFRYIRIKGADSDDPEHRAYMTPALNIFTSSEAQLSCTRSYPGGGTKTYVMKPEAEAAGLKRFEIKGSNSNGTLISEGTNSIESTVSENGKYTTYDLKEVNGDIEPSSLKINTYKKGDLNSDGRINIADAVIMQSWLLGAGDKLVNNWKAADFCEDGEINVFDMTALRRILVKDIAESKEEEPPVSALSPTLPSVGKNRIPVFAVEFPDFAFDGNDVTGKIETACFGAADEDDAVFPYESIAAYFERSSYGELRLTGDVFAYKAKHTSDSYAVSNGASLVEEVLAAFDGKLDYNIYDSNCDKILDSMIMILPKNAGKADGDGDGIPDWWPFSVKYYGYERYDGVKPGTYCAGAFAADDRSGIVRKMTHELCHAMGLPDYYRTAEKYDNEAMTGDAGYELMDEGLGDLSAFSKLMLGWLKDEDIYVYDGGSREYSITSMQQDPASVIIPRYKDSGFLSEFFIVEYITGEGNNAASRQGGSNLFNVTGGIRVMHCQAEVSDGQYGMEFSYSNNGALYDKSGEKERILRLISGGELISSYNSTTKFIDADNPDFRWYDGNGEQTVYPGVSIRVDVINYGPDYDPFAYMSHSGNYRDISDMLRGSSYTIEISQNN